MSTALITAPSWLDRKQWTEDCFRWRGKLLTGVLAHWCWDWDFLPVDETTPEITCCGCFTKSITSQSNTEATAKEAEAKAIYAHEHPQPD